MNIRDMQDREVYERGFEVLLDKLGPTGTIRFLKQCKPATDDYTAERHKWLDKLDMETILQEIQELRQKKQENPQSEPPKAINQMTDLEVYRLGLNAISEKLGPSGQMRFLRQCKLGTNDDTVERLKSLDKPAMRTEAKRKREVDTLREKE